VSRVLCDSRILNIFEGAAGSSLMSLRSGLLDDATDAFRRTLQPYRTSSLTPVNAPAAGGPLFACETMVE